MSSRDEILAALRRHTPEEAAAPDLNQAWITYTDPVVQFQKSVAAVGGKAVRVKAVDLAAAIHDLDICRTAHKTASGSRHATIEGIDLNAITDPHDLEDLDVFITDGTLGVAENGAIWLTDEQMPHRVAPFITQHLILTVESRCIVHNMHEAYQQIIPMPSGFGVFISGPSKTADIEQSLVIGAHGARSLTVFILDA